MDLTDVTSSGLLAFLASTIEIAVAISIACLPFLRALWRASSTKGFSSSNNNHYHHHGSGSGGVDRSGASGHHFSLGASGRSPKSDGFGHLPDDSSEIQLRPVGLGEGPVGQDTRIFAGASSPGVGGGHEEEEEEEEAYAGVGKRGLVVKVETRWDVETSSPVAGGLS